MDAKQYLEKLFAIKNIPVTDKNRSSFDGFCKNEHFLKAVTDILAKQNFLMDEWKLKNRVDEIVRQAVMIPNGTVGKAYQAILDFEKWNWQDVIAYELAGAADIGLSFDTESKTLSGTPSASGDIKLNFNFRIIGEEEKEEWHTRTISLIINPDPKSLWKDIPSDKEAQFWKKDNVATFSKLGEKNFVVASKRGRSHANVGSFRDDDFTFAHHESSGWSIIAVSDGAGSATFSREGARIACQSVVNYFQQKIEEKVFNELDQLLIRANGNVQDQDKKDLNLFLYKNLGGAAKNAQNQIQDCATSLEASLKDFHATLIFTLVKKYDFGYAILSFGVGDCPIAVVYEQRSAVSLMNTMDVGEFGGGTRFITMPEIFQADNFASRIGFKIVKDFDFLVLMTDGIYDPKFEVEANLVKVDKWNKFIDDLGGANQDSMKVNFDKENTNIATELDKWMDFWSPGNHDDRTLAILF